MKKVQEADRETQSSPGQRILFTGPDGTEDFRPRLDYFPRSIGIGPLSPDASSDLNYLFRPAALATPPLPKHCYVGEVGWGLQYSTALNRRPAINLYDPRASYASQCLFKDQIITVQNQSQFRDKQPTCGKLAWNHSEDDNKQFPLSQRIFQLPVQAD
ncbi:uncharacterized protein C4orf45 [Sinocyclocheilus grahami]|uniref:uncharacterized protein C4orf45 n=1 Tax=Sinocyclocheilus grahami TaxID=75366 RepID=UPI0007AC5409|nr:PREDICTED: uncharacterized protein C4orf45 homolog [Sinocyclocheilus grahami]